MTAELVGYVFGVMAIAILCGMLVFRLARRNGRGRGPSIMAGGLTAALILVAPAFAQAQQSFTPEQAEGLRSFNRGFSARCNERCGDAGRGTECAVECVCLVGEFAQRVDPVTLEFPERGEPTEDEIVRFIESNRDAFLQTYAACGVAIE